MIALYEMDTIDLKAVHAKLGGTGVWIDTGRFMKGTRLHNPNGLFDLFSEYSGQTADEVRDLMIGWIYNNYRNVKGWTRMAMQHKNIEMNKWLEDMQKTTMHGDNITLYILSWMFNKHVFVHNSMYGWYTMPYHMEDNYQDIVDKCDLELVFLKCWAFGEVKKNQGPTRTSQTNVEDKNNTPASKVVIPSSVTGPNVIPGNARRRSNRASKKILPAPPKKVTQCTSSRKCQAVDYSKLDDGSSIPSPPCKRRKPKLLRKPSKTVMAAHKKRKQMSPLGTMKGTTVTMSTIPTPSSSSASTSTGQQIGTVMVSASADETKMAIAALLSLGSDLPQPDEDETVENAQLVPINPVMKNTADNPVPSSSASSAQKETKPAKPSPSVLVHKRFVTVEYKLRRRIKWVRKFRCGKCDRSFESQHDVNVHFKETHPPVKCDYCDRSFVCPASMLKHRYSHYETMIECDTCGKGFQFQSQLTEHRRVHQVIGDWVCFKPGCGKRFKWESELDTHLFNHRTTKLKCDQCQYENPDPRNMRAHKRKHSDKKSFICKGCGEAFTWVQQCWRHIKNNKCPGQYTS